MIRTISTIHSEKRRGTDGHLRKIAEIILCDGGKERRKDELLQPRSRKNVASSRGEKRNRKIRRRHTG